MEQEKIDALILAYLKGETTPEQDRALAEYLEESTDHQDYFADLRAVARYLEASRTGEKPLVKASPVRKRPSWIIPAAAAALFLMFGLGASQVWTRTGKVVYDNPGTKTIQVQLPDHSRVWLADGSTLSYNRRTFDRKRDVLLVGQADFDVTKNGKSPFRVETSSIEVTVHGTIFQVRDFPSEDYAEATLAEGAVSLRPLSGEDRFNISVGQRAVYKEKTREMTIEEVPVDQILLRRTGIISIENATIHQIVERIQTDFGVRLSAVSVGGSSDGTFTFSYPEKAPLGDVLGMLEVLTGYRFEAEPTSNIINK